MFSKYKENTSNPEIVRDYIAGMTDSYFIRQAPEHLRPYHVEEVCNICNQ
jgi:dGTPase